MGSLGGMRMKNEIKKRALEIALEKLELERTEAQPEITKSTTQWNPVLLRNISEITVRSAEESIIIRLDQDTGENVGWRYPEKRISSKRIEITKEEALEIAKSEIEIPNDAELEFIKMFNRGGIGHTSIVKWKHLVQGIEVENDYIIVKINPETRDVISVIKNWSEINE